MLAADHLHDLLQTEMDRQEFLAYLGAAALTILGVSGFLRSLTNPTLLRQDRTGHAISSNGYGGGAYGGSR
ncbi:MAG: hypothetical protein ACR2OU_06065 [Thermomicrobiales bacterium]